MLTKLTCQRRRFAQNDTSFQHYDSINKTLTSGLSLRPVKMIKKRKSSLSSDSNACRLKSSSICTSVLSNDIFRNALLALVIVLCYGNSLTGQFLHDDIPAIVDNPDVIGTRSFVELFTNDFWGMSMSHSASHKSYRPITTITFR